jgi:hypothetical protein
MLPIASRKCSIVCIQKMQAHRALTVGQKRDDDYDEIEYVPITRYKSAEPVRCQVAHTHLSHNTEVAPNTHAGPLKSALVAAPTGCMRALEYIGLASGRGSAWEEEAQERLENAASRRHNKVVRVQGSGRHCVSNNHVPAMLMQISTVNKAVKPNSRVSKRAFSSGRSCPGRSGRSCSLAASARKLIKMANVTHI